MKWFTSINWIMFPSGLNLFPLIECRKSYNVSTGRIQRSYFSLSMKTVTNVMSQLILVTALVTQFSYMITSGLNVPEVGIEGLNLFTKFVWSSTLLINLAINRSKIRSLVTMINDLIHNDPLIRKRLVSISRVATVIYFTFIAAEICGIAGIIFVVGHLHYFKMYSISALIDRALKLDYFKQFIDDENFSLLDYTQMYHPNFVLLCRIVQHWFHLCFMTGSLYTFLVLVTFLEIAASKIYIWKLAALKEMSITSTPTDQNMVPYVVGHGENKKVNRKMELDTVISAMRSIRIKVQEIRVKSDHIFSFPILFSLSILFLDTGLRLSVKQIKLQKSEAYMKKYIFWLGILFHIMKAAAHVLMIILLDNVYEEADAAEVDLVNSVIEVERLDRGLDGSHTQVGKFRNIGEAMTGQVNGQLQNLVNQSVGGSRNLDSIQLMILEMVNNKLRRLTAWNMFIVQKSVILAFLGSVIPFAVIVVGFFTPEVSDKIVV